MDTQKVHFSKAILSNAFFVRGKAVPFEPVGGNEGVIALDPVADKDMVAGLTEAAAASRGGIQSITAEQYAQKKTAQGSKPFAQRPKEILRAMPQSPNPFGTRTTEAKAAPPADPAAASPAQTVPAAAGAAPAESGTPAAAPDFRPATRRISRKPDPLPAT